MNKNKETSENNIYHIIEELVVTDHEVVPIIFHEQKSKILKLLIDEEMTIIDLKHKTGLNPGTIKRHITDLLKHNLIFISKEKINEFSIVMKYYRATAKSILFNVTWPK